MGIYERRAREKRELRQEILDAARDLFVREGFEHVSMRKIAERIEYSPTTIYLYFQDKADLLDCICEETFARLYRKLSAIEATVEDPMESLRQGLEAYIDFGLKHPNHYKVAFMMDKPQAPDQIARSRAMGQKLFEHLCKTLTRCVEQQRIPEQDLQATGQAIWASIHGLTALLISRPSFPWVERQYLIDTMLDLQIEGLKMPRKVQEQHDVPVG
jgi:AcrR family transcriptional regulator